ncbi:hypothetical protein E4U21_001600 [Claviceps maximensis]|nr:hypothetical protein E4U21_001600 [Claviceps maximensis]
MYCTALRTASRQALGGLRAAQTPRSAPRLRRLASTATHADRPRSWKSSALRWGLAVAAVYYYNTSPVFAEEGNYQEHSPKSAPSSFAESDLPTVDSVVEQKRQHLKARTEEHSQTASSAKEAESTTPETQNSTDSQTTETASDATTATTSPQASEEEAGQQAAFNPETGEINWDCPCLGGMAHGPCGEEFKTAFSCFVYSSEEPKGMDCIDKFQGMQECFRQYPDIYGAELADDEETDELAPESEQTPKQGLRLEEQDKQKGPETNQATDKENTSDPSKSDTAKTEKLEEVRPVASDGAPKA